MALRYMLGDLFASDAPVLVHGCNAEGIMGGGVAALVRVRFPAAYAAYRAAFETGGLRLGAVVWAQDGGRLIGHAITQATAGRDPSGVHVDYTAIAAAMQAVNAAAVPDGSRVAMPQIGAGLGGGDWRRIAPIIAAAVTRLVPEVYVLDRDVHAELTRT